MGLLIAQIGLGLMRLGEPAPWPGSKSLYRLLVLLVYPQGSSTQYLRTLVPKAVKGMVFRTRFLKYLVLGAFGLEMVANCRTYLFGPGRAEMSEKHDSARRGARYPVCGHLRLSGIGSKDCLQPFCL